MNTAAQEESDEINNKINDSVKQYIVDCSKAIENLFDTAKKKDEYNYICSLLNFSGGSFNGGAEAEGWNTFSETVALFYDIIDIVHLLNDVKLDTQDRAYKQIRILLFQYSQIIETSYLWHLIYNMLLTIEGKNWRMWNFDHFYKNGNPPSVKTKVGEIIKLSDALGIVNLSKCINTIFNYNIRNAIIHADFILFKG